MKNKVIVVSCLLALLFSGNEAKAASVEARATATIMTAISASKNEDSNTGGDLVFGVIIPGETSGTVTISPFSFERRPDGGVALAASNFGPASFNVYGGANTVFTIALPDTDPIISSGSNTMKVQSLTVYPPGSVTLDNLGKATFNVGGTLIV